MKKILKIILKILLVIVCSPFILAIGIFVGILIAIDGVFSIFEPEGRYY